MSENAKDGAGTGGGRKRITLERFYRADVQDIWIMSGTVPSRRLARSVGAVAAGFAATAVLATAADAVMHATGVFPPVGQPMSDGLFVWAIVYRMAFTVLGGALTASLAPREPMAHVLVLGAIGIVAALAGTVATWNRGPEFGPKWYPILLVITALPCVWAGGALVRRKQMT